MPEASLRFSLIIPAFNESKRLPRYLGECLDFLDVRFGSSYEIVVVDDGSQDATADFVRREFLSPRVRILQHPLRRGKGAAVRTGMLASGGALRLFTDADGATPISALDRLLVAVEQGWDLAIGSRATVTKHRIRHCSARSVASNIFSLLVRTRLGLNIADTQCGFKLFRAAVAESLFGHLTRDGFSFDVELLCLAHKFGFSVCEVPVEWREMPGSKVRLLRDSCVMLQDLWRIRKGIRS